jgi:hypothetical protein
MNNVFVPSGGHWAWADSVAYRERVTRKQAQSVLLEQKTSVKNGNLYEWKFKHVGCGIYDMWLEPPPRQQLGGGVANEDLSDALRFRYLTADLAGEDRKQRNALLDRMGTMSYAAVCQQIDCDLEAQAQVTKAECTQSAIVLPDDNSRGYTFSSEPSGSNEGRGPYPTGQGFGAP